MARPDYTLYEKLKPKLGEEEARALLEHIDSAVEKGAATKEDLRNTREELKGDIAKLREELKGDIAKLREELGGEIVKVREELTGEIAKVRKEIESVKFDLLKWLFGFWVTLLAAILLRGFVR